MFKNNVLRYETPECKIINPPISLNEGRYRVDFNQIDAKMKTPALEKKTSEKGKKRFFDVAPCVLNKAECSLQSRKNAR